MMSLGMGGFHPLTPEKVDEEVTRTSAGTYALGQLDEGVFVPFYVGRSDSDLREGLRSRIGVDRRGGRYTHFAFCYAASADAAFQNECRNYHDLGGSYGLDNERHPAPSEGVPRCREVPCS